MKLLTLTLKNYRNVEDAHPAVIEVNSGFTALVGPNNSGKSSFLRFIYETRNLWGYLQNINNLAHLATGAPTGANLLGVEDPSEVLYNRNQRSMIVQLDLPCTKPSQISRIVLRMERAKPDVWAGEVFAGIPHVKLVSRPDERQFEIPDGSRIEVDVEQLIEASRGLANALYIGPFRNAINEGAGAYYDLTIGTSFVDMWDDWKTGPYRRNNQAVQDATEDIARIFGYQRLEINAAKNPRTLQVIVDGKPFRLRELGAGLAQFIIVLGNVAIRRPSYLLIDEPELNLHPSLQADFLTSLVSYTSGGVMFASHSLGLARTTAEHIYTFQRKDEYAVVRPFEQTANFAEFAGEMSFSAFKELGHEVILLVEGTTEVKAIQQFLRLLHKEHEIVVLPLGGSAMIRSGVQVELAELERLTHKVAVIIDSERRSPDAVLTKDRQGFIQECKQLGFKVLATQRRAFENYLTEQAVQKVKGGNYKALEPYERLADAQLSWGKHDNWRIARQMSRDELLASDVGQFLNSLGE